MWPHLRSVVLACCGLLVSSMAAAAAGPAPGSRVPRPAAKSAPRTVTAKLASMVPILRFYDRDSFRRIIRRHVKEMKYCYEQALQHRSDLTGRQVLQLIIAADGAVLTAAILDNELHAPALAACMVAAAARWQFTPTTSPGITIVTYPYVLKPVAARTLVMDGERRAAIRACHAQALWRHGDVAGALTLRIGLDDTARVRAATVTATSISDAGLLHCIRSAAQRWRFADSEGSTTFEKTLWLQPVD